jgi:hypothetical protein
MLTFPLAPRYTFVTIRGGSEDPAFLYDDSNRDLGTRVKFGKRGTLSTTFLVQPVKQSQRVVGLVAVDLPSDLTGAAYIRSVEIIESHRGKRLCRPMLSHVLRELGQAGYKKAELFNDSDKMSACMCYLRVGKDAGFQVHMDDQLMVESDCPSGVGRTVTYSSEV